MHWPNDCCNLKVFRGSENRETITHGEWTSKESYCEYHLPIRWVCPLLHVKAGWTFGGVPKSVESVSHLEGRDCQKQAWIWQYVHMPTVLLIRISSTFQANSICTVHTNKTVVFSSRLTNVLTMVQHSKTYKSNWSLVKTITYSQLEIWWYSQTIMWFLHFVLIPWSYGKVLPA